MAAWEAQMNANAVVQISVFVFMVGSFACRKMKFNGPQDAAHRMPDVLRGLAVLKHFEWPVRIVKTGGGRSIPSEPGPDTA
jgi:hypothetical protein